MRTAQHWFKLVLAIYWEMTWLLNKDWIFKNLPIGSTFLLYPTKNLIDLVLLFKIP
jgi:hypothetical protein